MRILVLAGDGLGPEIAAAAPPAPVSADALWQLSLKSGSVHPFAPASAAALG